MTAISLRDVTKRFGKLAAVENLSLTVPAGCVYGFIGPNGSGKTTTIRMIMNILLPDEGEIEVLGERATSAVRDRVGYLPEERGLYKKMQVRRLLRYYGHLKAARGPRLESDINEWLARMDLTAWAEKPIETLSKGMSQKVQFIAAVISRPDLLVLDEPFSGLDPVNAEVLKDAVLEMRRRGATVVLSTHDMGTAERMCDRLFMIFRGRKVLDGTLDEIQAAYGFDTVRLRIEGSVDLIRSFSGVQAVNDFGRLQEVRMDASPQALLRHLVAQTVVHHFEVSRPSLHDIFIRIARPDAATAAELATAGAD